MHLKCDANFLCYYPKLIEFVICGQKEREHTKEAKRKAEEMKSKMQWLRTQKRDLESRISEMKSTISLLRDEQRIIEATLEEKQDEVNMLRENLTETNPEDSQAKLLSESLQQQKEAETELPVKIWSVSADDPSNPTMNFTTKATRRKEANGGETEEMRESVKRDDQKNSTETLHRNADESALKRDEATGQGEDREQAQDVEGSADWSGYNRGQESQELRTVQEDVPGNRSTTFKTLDGQRENTDSSKAGENFPEEKRYDNGDSSVETINHSGEGQKQSNEVSVIDDATDQKQNGTALEVDIAYSQGNNQESGRKYKDGLKLEMKDNHKSTDASRVKQEHIRKTKGKSRRIIAESKVTGSGGNTEKRNIVSMRNRKFFKKIQEGSANERVGGSKQEKQEHKQEKSMDPDSMNDYVPEDIMIDMTYKTQRFENLEENFGNQVGFEPEQKDMRRQRMQDDNSNLDDAPARITVPKPKKSTGTEEGIQEGRKSDTNEITEMSQSSQEVPTETAASNVNRDSNDARNKKWDETTRSQEAISMSREHQEQAQTNNFPISLKHANTAERDVKADDLQVENDQETEGKIDQSRGISQEVSYRKSNSTARAEEKNSIVLRDTEQRLAGHLRSSSTHVKSAETALQDSNLDTENDKETENKDHSKSSAANLEEEGENVN
ncbi:hypothetical protein HAX54_031377 [Datura stramonium]|uniref:Uncharacterized protein n=1 Tax=Datura stramonium TaxID=4076 RepID=A0ABS8VBY9_DATST|nr:hypothetical protein [Datura stramonium]